jgi:hypothetical protein
MMATVRGVRDLAWVVLAVSLADLTGGCGSSAPTPTAPSSSTEYFVGTLAVGGSASYAFSVVNDGSVQVTLTGLTTSRFSPQNTTISVGVGIPAGEGCGVSQSVMASPGLANQLLTRFPSGTYCVQVSDPGTLSGPVSFVVRILHF